MFGDRYFAIRQRFTDVVTRVRDLGGECEIDVEALVDDGDFFEGTPSAVPCLFLWGNEFGEVNFDQWVVWRKALRGQRPSQYRKDHQVSVREEQTE